MRRLTRLSRGGADKYSATTRLSVEGMCSRPRNGSKVLESRPDSADGTRIWICASKLWAAGWSICISCMEWAN